MLIYFDLCALQRPDDDQSQRRVQVESAAVARLLGACAAGTARFAASDALLEENSRNPHPDGRVTTAARLATAVVYQPATAAVRSRAATLIAGGLGPGDALHLASAEAIGADYLCTCDDKLLKRGRTLAAAPLRVVSPIELVAELGR